MLDAMCFREIGKISRPYRSQPADEPLSMPGGRHHPPLNPARDSFTAARLLS